MGVFTCLKGDPEDQTDVKIAKPCILKRMWRGVKAKFSKKTRKEKKLLKALADEAEKAEKRRKCIEEQREREKEEAQAFEMVRILWGLDENVVIGEAMRKQKEEKALKEKAEREKAEAEGFEMIRILWGLDENADIGGFYRKQKEMEEVEALELIVEDIRLLFDQDKSDKLVLEFTNEQKELLEVKDQNSKAQKDRIAEFEMVLEDLRFLFNEDAVCGEQIIEKHKTKEEREIETLELIVEDIRGLFDQEKEVHDFVKRQKELFAMDQHLLDLMGDRFVDEDKEIEILEKKFEDFMAAFHATQSEDAYRRFQREASVLEQRLSNVLDLLMDEEAGFAMTADEAAECDEVLTKCHLSKNDVIGDFNIINRITI